MNTADFLAIPPQERWAIIEEHIFGRMVFRNHITKEPTHCRAGRGVLYKGVLVPVRDFDEANGWWEIVLEMARQGWEYSIENIEALESGEHMAQFQKPQRSRLFEHADIALAVQVAALRALGALTD